MTRTYHTGSYHVPYTTNSKPGSGYQALVFDTRTVTGSPNPTVNGTYRTTNHVGGATFRLNF